MRIYDRQATYCTSRCRSLSVDVITDDASSPTRQKNTLFLNCPGHFTCQPVLFKEKPHPQSKEYFFLELSRLFPMTASPDQIMYSILAQPFTHEDDSPCEHLLFPMEPKKSYEKCQPVSFCLLLYCVYINFKNVLANQNIFFMDLPVFSLKARLELSNNGKQ